MFFWNSLAFSMIQPMLASLLFTAICKASPDSHFAFLHFFSMGMVLIPVSCRMSRASFHSSSGTLSIRLDLKNYGQRFMTLYRRQGSRPSPRKKKCKKAKWLSEEALQTDEKRREAKDKGEKETYTHLKAEFQRIARKDKKAFLYDQCKEIKENSIRGKTRDLLRK